MSRLVALKPGLACGLKIIVPSPILEAKPEIQPVVAAAPPISPYHCYLTLW
jgi:hypothetical protein